jgi:hypothetical protein
VRIEPEGGFPTEEGACRSQNLEDMRVGDEARFPLVGYGVDGSGASSAGECAENSLLLGLWFDSPLLATILATGGISIFGDSSL